MTTIILAFVAGAVVSPLAIKLLKARFPKLFGAAPAPSAPAK